MPGDHEVAVAVGGSTLINGAVSGGCSRCDAPSIEAYLAGLTG